MLQTLPAQDAHGSVHVVVDTPKGSRNKVKYDESLKVFRLSRILPVGAIFPCNFGFIPSTRAADGDALDVAVLMDEALQAGTLITVRLLGVLQATQTKNRRSERNDRLIAVPVTPVNEPPEQDLSDVSTLLLDELEHFFVSYNAAQGRTFKVTGRRGAGAAARVLRQGCDLFKRQSAS